MAKTYIFGHQNPDTDAIASAIIMADFEQLVSGKTYARNTQFITEIGERHLVKGETMDLVVDFFKEASKTLEK